MTGPPDLVVEIVSPDSGLIDRRRKFDLYERFGVFGPEDTVTAVAVPELVVSLAEVFAEEG